MTIVYFYQYFSTPNGSWGTRVFESGKRWVAKGDRVIVVTSIYDKSDLKASGIRSKFNFEGVETIVLNVKISNKHPILYRIYTFLMYSLLSSYYALTLKADVVVASSGPITVALPALVARYFRRRKLVFEVRDLWPEGAIQMGVLKNKFVQKLAYALESRCYKAAHAVIALSPGMQKEIQDAHHHPNVHSVPNASDNSLFSKDTSSFVMPDWAVGKQIYLYTGNIGKVNNSWWVAKAAEMLQNKGQDSILFLFIGDGQQRGEIQEFIDSKGLRNMRILGLMPKSDLVAWVQRAYFMMVPLEGKPILDTSSPNKLFDAMAAGIPTIQNTQGWIKDLLATNECGITIPFNRSDLLCDFCIDFKDKQAERDRMGVNSKQTAMKEFDRDMLANKMHGILTATANA